MQPTSPAVAPVIEHAPLSSPPSPPLRPRRAKRRRARSSRWARLLVFVVVVIGVLALVGGEQPGESVYIAAAAQARTTFRYDRALALYAAAARQNPSDGRPYCLRGDVLTLQQEAKSAEAAYLRCTQLSPDDPRAWLSLGDARQTNHDSAGAVAAWTQSAALGGANALRRLGVADERQQRFDDAVAEWQRLPASDPEALEHLGVIALWRGDTATARADLVAARAQPSAFRDEIDAGGFAVFAAQPPATSDAYGRMGYAFLSQGMSTLALRPLQTAITLDPNNGDAHAYLGWALWQSGQTSDALAQETLARRLSPHLAFGWYASGEMAVAAGKFTDAENDFLQGVTYDGRNSTIWDALGHVQRQLRKYYQAELDFQNAATLSSDPRFTIDWLHYFTDFHIGFSSSDTARYAANTAIRMFPENGEVRDLVGAIYDLSGLINDAYFQWQQANALDPTDPGPYIGLARYAENQSDFVQAAWELRTALALQPNGPDAPAAHALLAVVADVAV
ncbi:MAG TPA: tetratricopeptide repeat protein [Ktedonobacterales bacterium]|nr:tetratricopeptide repeat protein [Ktedonobacterales bacterium]